MIDIGKQILSTDNHDWEGWYRLTNGNMLKCEEYECCSSWEDEWEGLDPLPDGAVYYDVYDESKQEITGGVMAYTNGDEFSDFMDFVSECGHGSIECKIPDVDIDDN